MSRVELGGGIRFQRNIDPEELLSDPPAHVYKRKRSWDETRKLRAARYELKQALKRNPVQKPRSA